jgi:RNA polymerase sigma factor (sigma-70 family)
MQEKSKIKEYLDIVQKVAKVEHHRIPSHMIEYEELVSIGIIAVQVMIKNKTEEQLEKYNAAYIGTAVRWAIRNELRNRYKWYTLKHTKTEDVQEGLEVEDASEDEDGLDVSPGKVREAIYETILSIDSIAAASSDNDSPFDFIKDLSAMPDEKAEISEMGRMIREAISTLPQKDRTVVEYRFYRNMQVKDIARQVGLSSSRITRIVQSSLNIIREYLQSKEHFDY